MADIHITNNETRHQEYEQVFENLYRILKQDEENKLIVICGDLFHEKNNHQNKQNILAKEFINKLSSYGEIVIIDGNHDYIPHNDNSSSSICSLLHHLKVVNPVHYLTENKIYNIHNINFGVTTMNSSQVTPIPNKQPNELYIGLYHGSLYKSITDIGWVNDDETSFKASDFKSYDITMLGDIHKFSFINKEKTMAYASSLIQQNFGESITNHGLIKWNLETKKGEFIQVPNNWVYKVHTITDINDYTIPDIIDKKTRLKLIYKNQKREDIDKYKKEINKKYMIINLRQEEQYDEKSTIIKDGKLINKSMLEVYNEYLQEYKLKEDFEITIKISECIEKFNTETSHKIKNLKLKTLEFDNLFTYGSNNKINFESLEGLNIITGANGLGKSSIVDIILFTIFNTFSRGRGKDALNIRHINGKSKITLDLNGEIYEIIRKIHKNRAEVEIIKDGKTITSDTKIDTDDLIYKIFGNYQDMVMSSIILQVGQNFIDMAEKEKKTTLINILGLDIYENVYAECIREKRELSSSKITDLNKQITDVDNKKLIIDKEQEINEINEQLNLLDIEKTKILEEYYSIQKAVDKEILLIDKNLLKSKTIELNNKISEYEKNIIINKYNKFTVDNLNIQKEDIMENNETLNKEINNLYRQIVKIQKIDTNQKIILNLVNDRNEKKIELEKLEIDIMEIKMDYSINNTDYNKQIRDLENEISEYKKTFAKRENDFKILKLLEDKNKNLLKHTFNDNCSSCKSNKLIHYDIGYLEEIEKIKKEINSFNVKTDILHNEKTIGKLREIIENENKITLLNSQIELVNKKIDFEENNIKQHKLNEIIEIKNNELLKNIEDKENEIMINKKEYAEIISFIKIIYECENIKKIIDNNNNLLKKIEIYDNELLRINELNNEKEELNKKNEFSKKKLYGRQIELNNLIIEDKKQDKLKKELDIQFKKMNIIDKTTKLFKDGFKEYILKNKAIVLEKKINNTLLNLANYEIKIDTSDNNISFFKVVKNVKTNIPKKTKSKIKIIEDVEDIEEESDIKLLNVRELCGFERVSFNIALRVALNSMNIINKNNFLIIDESFTYADQNNIHNITYLFDIIKKEYELCLIISHLTEIKNLNERKIEITKDVKTTDSKIYIE
jgi:DNA repair exonuclease SbcCD ATPase subunit